MIATLVGVPKEIKDHEYRVGLIPSTVRELVSKGHRVLAENGAGISDDAYLAAGAELVARADELLDRAELIVKAKEPLAQERKKLKRGQMLFTYVHLAADLDQTEALMTSRVSSIAYETVTSAQGTLPLLVPMSEVADHMAPQVGAHYLEKENGGRGVMTSSRSITLARSTSRFLDFSLSTTIRRKASAGLPGSMMACRRCLYSGWPKLRI